MYPRRNGHYVLVHLPLLSVVSCPSSLLTMWLYDPSPLLSVPSHPISPLSIFLAFILSIGVLVAYLYVLVYRSTKYVCRSFIVSTILIARLIFRRVQDGCGSAKHDFRTGRIFAMYVASRSLSRLTNDSLRALITQAR